MPYQNPYVPQPTYNPYIPQQYRQPIQEQPIHGFIFVHGIDGAYAYHLPNGSEMPLFDDDETKGIMYIKKVDFNGRATVEVKDVYDHVEQSVDYATRDDLNAIYAEIDTLRSALTQPAYVMAQQAEGIQDGSVSESADAQRDGRNERRVARFGTSQ